MKLTRTEKWMLQPSSENRQYICMTIALYQRYIRALSSVYFTHWKVLGSLSSKDVMNTLERLIHSTKQRPLVKYPYFNKVSYKFPSYLRRSAIHDALGQIKSFLNRYDQWQTNASRKAKHSRPPVFGVSNTYPSLYKGQCIKYAEDLRSAQIKVYKDNDWKWIEVRIKRIGKRASDVTQKQVSPQLVSNGKKAFLAVPYEQNVKLVQK